MEELNISKDLREELLSGWLSMSTVISNERLVSVMTFNESMVCGALYRQRMEGGEMLTATRLCRELRILKPQMNAILNRLEREGMIRRIRSDTDRRQIFLSLTEQGVPVYEAAHEEILQMPQELIERLGEEKMKHFAAMMKEVSDCFLQMQKRAQGSQITGGPVP